MRDFSWRCFAATGAIDAYLLYKEHEAITNQKVSEGDFARTSQEVVATQE